MMMSAAFPQPFGSSPIANANPYANQHYSGSVEVFYKETPIDAPPDITIQTDHLSLRPLTSFTDLYSKRSVYEFYGDLLGSRDVMVELGDGRVREEVEVSLSVDSYIKRWMAGDFLSAFVVYRSGGLEPIAHTILDHGRSDGNSRFEVLMPNASCDGEKLWIDAIHKEITYAMFMGWAPYLLQNGKLVRNDLDETDHPLSKISAIGTLKESTVEICQVVDKVLQTVEKRTQMLGNFAYRNFERLAKDPLVMGELTQLPKDGDKREHRIFGFSVAGLSALQSKLYAKIDV